MKRIIYCFLFTHNYRLSKIKIASMLLKRQARIISFDVIDCETGEVLAIGNMYSDLS